MSNVSKIKNIWPITTLTLPKERKTSQKYDITLQKVEINVFPHLKILYNFEPKFSQITRQNPIVRLLHCAFITLLQVLTLLTRIHNIGHIHNTDFAQTQFSMSSLPKTQFLKNTHFTFFENISFAGLKSKFLSTQQNCYMSPTHHINMSSIGLKLMKIEQAKKNVFFSGHCRQ